MKKISFLFACLLSTLLLSVDANPAHAQRRILGDAQPEEEKQPEGEQDAPPASPPAGKSKNSDEKNKQAQEKQEKAKREAEAKAQQEAAEQEKAEAAAKAEQEAAEKRAAEAEAERKAAEEAKRKAEEEALKKAEEAQQKEQERLDGLRDGRLQAAKTRRQYMRESGKLRATIALEPGAPKTSKMMEVRMQLGEQLKVADPRFGSLKPRPDFNLVATVREPAKRKPVVYRYRMHPLPTPGSYGFHHTLRLDGEHTIQIEGTSADGEKISLEVPVHAGVWPPPDFDDEDANTRRLQERSGQRRTLGAN